MNDEDGEPADTKAPSPVDFVRKVGKGKNLSRDLSRAEAQTAFSLLSAGN